ncbi:histone-lysine N-methyltransferase SETMAR [Trichonephila clavipes]|nr:histone-lysine N-methyltransferase SETMAR [Trichonephila clavipes]
MEIIIENWVSLIETLRSTALYEIGSDDPEIDGPVLEKFSVTGGEIRGWYWARTRDKASHGPIPIPLGYRGHTNYLQFWFRRFRSRNFDVKDASRTGRSLVENVEKLTEIIKLGRYASSHSIGQELKIKNKTVLSHIRKVGLKKKLHVRVPHQLTPKNMIDRSSNCETLAKQNEIDSFLKRMVTGDEK